MQTTIRIVIAATMMLVIAAAEAQDRELTFDNVQTLAKFTVTGDVTIDSGHKHGGDGALKLDPGATVRFDLRSDNGTGTVDFWVYEDGSVPTDSKKHAAGPMWGLQQANGHILSIGPIYAPYLSGDTTYATAAFNPNKQERPWQEVQYLGIRRAPGWHHWTFDFDPGHGLRILLNGKDINENHERFNWNKSRLDGFTRVVLFGDAADLGQTLWVDDLHVTLGPPAAKSTRWPPPPPLPPADLAVLPPQATQNAAPFARWKNGPSQSTDYFPIAVWLQDPKLAPKYKAAGFNLYIGLWQGPTEQQLDTLRQAHMPVICAQTPLALEHLNDKIIVGWMHGDEPDNAHPFAQFWHRDKERIKEAWPELYKSRRLDKNEYRGYGPPVPPKWIVRDYEKIRANDPTRPIMVNLGQGVAWEQYKGRGERTGHLEDYQQYIEGCDIVSFDIYPAAHQDLNVKDALWYVARGVTRLRNWSRDRKIVWNALECTTISVPGAKPTPAQVKAEIWMSIIHGSRGLIYFVHQFKPTMNEHALLDDPDMLAMVTATNHRIQQLASVLNSPSIPDAVTVKSANVKTPVHAIARRAHDATYVFAVAMYQEPTAADFQVAGLRDGATVEVLDEKRTVRADGSKFHDEFVGNGVHLYRIGK